MTNMRSDRGIQPLSLQVKFIKGYGEIQMVNPINMFQTQNQKCFWGKAKRLRTISAVQVDFCFGFLTHANETFWAKAVLTMGMNILTMAMIRHNSLMVF